MTDVSSVQNQNLALANWLYGVQNVQTPQHSITSELGTNIAFGVPLIAGAPVAIKYGSKPYQVYKEMKGSSNVNYFQAWKNLNEKNKALTAHLKDDKSFIQTMKNKHEYKNLINYEKELPSYNAKTDVSKLNAKQLAKLENTKIKSGYYDEAKRLIQEAKDKKMTGAELKEQLKKIRAAIQKGDLKVNEALQNGTIKPNSKAGKASHWLKTKTGVYKAESKLLQTSKGASALKLAKKGVKGTWIMAAIEGVLEIPDVIKAYNIDKEEKKQGISNNRGNKQLAKSATKVGASVLGYAAGAAAAGAIAGTVVPGIGNVAGAVIGFVGGLIGGAIASWGAGKVMDAALGEKDSLNKSEAEIYAEEQNNKKQEAAKQLAQNASESADVQEELLLATAQKAQEEGGFDDEETLNAFNELVAQRESTVEESESLNNYNQYLDNTSQYDPVVSQLETIANLNYAA